MDWLKQNGMSLVIAAITLVSTFTLYGFRISVLETQRVQDKEVIEARLTQDEKTLTKLSQTFTDTNLQTQVSLAKIQTDLEYLKVQTAQIVTILK